MSALQTFEASLRHAARERQTATVGGGHFTHQELEEVLGEIEALRNAKTQLEAMMGEQEPVACVGSYWNDGKGFDLCDFSGNRPAPGAKLYAAPVAQQPHVGDSQFESWYSSEYDPNGKGDKQRARDAYAAGMSDPVAQQPQAEPDDEILKERDDAEDFIDMLLDEVLGTDRPEWTSAYGRDDALRDVQERMTALHKPTVDKAWDRFEKAHQPQAEAYGYVDETGEPVRYENKAHRDEVKSAIRFGGLRELFLSSPQQAEAVPPDVARDAERYRWLKNNCLDNEVESNGKFGFKDFGQLFFEWRRREWKNGKPYVARELDAAIDAAMAQGANHG